MYHPFFVCIWLKNSIFGEFSNIYLLSAQNRVKWRHKIQPIAKNFRPILIFFARDDAKLMPGEVCQVSCRYSNKWRSYSRKTEGGGSDPTPPPGGGGLIGTRFHYVIIKYLLSFLNLFIISFIKTEYPPPVSNVGFAGAVSVLVYVHVQYTYLHCLYLKEIVHLQHGVLNWDSHIVARVKQPLNSESFAWKHILVEKIVFFARRI